MDTTTILFIVLFVWLIVLSGVLVWLIWVLRNLLKDAKDKDFLKQFRQIEQVQSSNTKDIKVLQNGLEGLSSEVLGHVQKVGLVKFNPYSETGGDHSFSLALLDGKKNGIIITSLHSREATRVYIKDLKTGKSSIELSKEEKRALESADE